MSGIRIAISTFSVVLALGLMGATPTPDAPAGAPEKLIANAINLGSARALPRAQAGFVLITIDRLSTPEERQTLVDGFKQNGQNGLLQALQKVPSVGLLRTPDHVGWEIHYAYQVPGDNGGRRVFLATDRRVSLWEAYRDTRSSDYPFTLVELRLDADSKGEGRMSLATKVSPSKDGQHIELESYGSDPVRLQGVRPEK